MEKLIPTFTDITSWEIPVYQSTGGTRSKNIAIHPETGDQYFFKGSKETDKGEIRYPQEFWSEIVASKIGQLLGFKMLDYNIAYNKNKKQEIGCLSKSMVVHSDNKLTEGVTYLTGFDSKYRPDILQHKRLYTFQFICSALQSFHLENHIENLVEVIIFDSIIGNSDRHQENWGIITNFRGAIHNPSEETSVAFFSKTTTKLEKVINRFLSNNSDIGDKIIKPHLVVKSDILPNEFAPIYDSGCCLGRENLDEKIFKLLNDKNMLDAYVKKGVSEIHWEGEEKKKNHFNLIELIETKHRAKVLSVILNIKEKYSLDALRHIINHADSKLPDDLRQFKLEEHRKELMFKLVTLRLELLFNHI